MVISCGNVSDMELSKDVDVDLNIVWIGDI